MAEPWRKTTFNTKVEEGFLKKRTSHRERGNRANCGQCFQKKVVNCAECWTESKQTEAWMCSSD